MAELIRFRRDFVNSISSVSDNEWHFVSVVRGQDYVELWLDGELVETQSWSGEIDYTSSTIRIGQTAAGDPLPFNGLIDDLRLFTLKDMAISNLYGFFPILSPS